MAFRLEIKGNFFVASDYATRVDIMRRPVSEINFLRQGDYFIFLNNGSIVAFENSITSNILGNNQDILGVDLPAPLSNSSFLYSDCEDSGGGAFATADDLDDWLSSVLGRTITYSSVDHTVDYLDFLQNPSVGGAERRLLWNDTDKTLDLGLNSSVTLQIGQETVLRAKNTSGSQIDNGSVVYLQGSTGANTIIGLADADDMTADVTIGLATEDIADNGFGFVTLIGLVRDIDTAHLIEGAKVWLSSTAGETTATKPDPPTHAVLVGFCVNKHASQGSILVSVQLGIAMEEIHNALIDPDALKGGDIISYNGDYGLWVVNNLTLTFELIDVLTVDYYPPYDITIDDILSQKAAGTITVEVNGSSYSYEDPINAYDKVTITTDAEDVVTFNATAINIAS